MTKRLLDASRTRPSLALKRERGRVLDVIARHKAGNVRVFGSVARGADTQESDIDLLVTFEPDADLFDLVEMTAKDGTVRQFIAGSEVAVSEDVKPDIARLKLSQKSRLMDCTDCHNRVGHAVPSPDRAIDGGGLAERYGQKTINALLDILDAGDAAGRLVGRGKPAYDGDEMLRFAAEAISQRIGEAVGRLSPEFTDSHADVASWHAIRGLNNLVAHGSQHVDHEIVWNALVRRLPNEVAQIRRLVDRSV